MLCLDTCTCSLSLLHVGCSFSEYMDCHHHNIEPLPSQQPLSDVDELDSFSEGTDITTGETRFAEMVFHRAESATDIALAHNRLSVTY